MEKEIKNYFFIGILFVLIVYSYFLIQDFITIIFSSVVLTYLLLPLHKKISKKINPYISSLICVVITTFILFLIVFLISQQVYAQINSVLKNETTKKIIEDFQTYLKKENIFYSEKILNYGESFLKNSLSFIGNSLFTFIKGIISFIIVLFFTYFLLIDWEILKKKFYEIIPFKNKEKILENINNISNSIIKTNLLIAIIEAIFSFLFFSIFNVPYKFLLSFIIFLLAFLPIIGPAVVWFPIVIFNFLIKNYSASLSFLIFGLILSYGIDSILRNIISSKKAKINPILMFLGVIGGIKVFGIAGVIIGPIILTTTIEIFLGEKD